MAANKAVAVRAVAVAARIATSTDPDAAWIATQTSAVWNYTRTVSGAEHALCKVYTTWPTPFIYIIYINLGFFSRFPIIILIVKDNSNI